MTARHSNVPNLTDFDLKLLRVFHAVVQAQGLAPAQQVLGLSLSTISIQLKQLEERLGFSLCERGRKGFSLTREGEQIHESLNPLFGSITDFRDVVAELRGNLSGDLHFGVVDALATNTTASLPLGFRRFTEQAPDVHLHVDISSPEELLQGLIDGRYHCILTPVEPTHDSIDTVPVFTERQQLYCGRDHPLFLETDMDRILEALKHTTLTDKSYASLPSADNPRVTEQGPTVSHMESNALLILSGGYVGYLPQHYADYWVDKRLMKPLLPDAPGYESQFYLCTSKHHTSRSTDMFVSCLAEVLLDSTMQ
ncbi:LysR family transcriptional regulator [Aidingimonas halophila]|uniref:DNA-binding transcriptional regulator, LysR family n=1 Tax=Aidingimonas halophila TaxID=574349 RepID=A0A1H2X4V3_9GAMM|nr:LysR family transcriptional regulator [Aidingimonas halophila]GHC28042.1 LysR family transcriptional regulator [Aidingimonas halophila]SDW87289.1 DNA-binding transcriptional regulator, LysR family [Aidingimonas halophila]